MVALREVLAAFRIDVDGGKFLEMDKRVVNATANLANLVKGAKLVGAAFLGSAVVQGVRSFAGNLANAGDEIDDLSAYLGLSSKELQTWRFAAGQNGLQAEQLTGAIQRLVAAQEGADNGGKRQIEAFKQLGIRYKDAHGNLRPLSEMLPDVAEGMSKLKDPTQQNAVALSLFGRQGLRLIPLLAQGKEGMAKYREELEALGGGFSDELVKNAGEYNDQLAKFDVAVDSLQSRIGTKLLPALTKLVDWMSRGLGWISRTSDAWGGLNGVMDQVIRLLVVLSPALSVLAVTHLPNLVKSLNAATTASKAFLRSLLPFAAPVAVFLALGLILEDIWMMFKGGESIIGEFFNWFFDDAQAAEGIVFAWRMAFWGLLGTVKECIAAVQDLWGWLSGGDTSHIENTLKELEASRPDKADEQARGKALQSGDAAGYVKHKRFTMTREQALEEFKGKRDGLIRMGVVKATDMDTASGLGGKTAYVPRGLPEGGTTINSPVNITVSGPSAADKETLERLRAHIGEEMDKRNRAAVAALGRGGR